jgi:Fe-S-cluster-containing dehydrogenase component
MQKCNLCAEIDIEPACAGCCPTEALKVGYIDEILEMAKGKGAKRMGGPTEPSVIIAGKLPVASLIT